MSKTSKRLYALLDIIENGVNSVTHFNELMNGDNDNSKYYYGKYKWNKKNNEQALISNRIDEDLKKRNIELCSYFKENDITVHTLDEKTQYGLLNHKNFRKLDVIEKKSLFQAIENRNASNEGRKAYYIENIDKGDKKDQIYEKPKDNNIVVLNLKKNNSYVLLKAYYSSIEENEIIKNKKIKNS